MKIFVKFDEACKIVESVGISNMVEWREWIKINKDKNIPYNPDRFYKNDGWINYNHFWGKKYKRKLFISYPEAKKIVNDNNIKTHLKFLDWVKNINNIPSDPNRVYKNCGWVSWGSFFNTKNKYKGDFLTYNECKKYLKNLNLSGYNHFIKWKKTYKYNDIPTNPNRVYKNCGWISWGDFLSTDNLQNKDKSLEFLTYDECKKYLKNLNLDSSSEFFKFTRPIFIPSSPSNYYKNKGWISWGDFLGNDKISLKDRSKLFLKYEDAKVYIQNLKLSHKSDYYNYVKNNKIKFLPLRPEYIYRENWFGYLDFVGCESLRSSYGERKIKEYLDSKSIEYIKEKKFDSCKNISKLPFDFYLPKYNVCIEYDGQHHFQLVSIYGGEKRFKEVKKHDKIKDKWCEKNDIKLLRIKYTKKNSIFKILDEFLK